MLYGLCTILQNATSHSFDEMVTYVMAAFIPFYRNSNRKLLYARTRLAHFLVPLYNCTTVVQLYDSRKTQNGHNFGHGHARDLYFTFLEMGKKVFIVKFFCLDRESNPGPRW